MYGTSRAEFPRRIVCLTAETAEIAFLLGAGDRIVGVPGTARRPEAALERARVGNRSEEHTSELQSRGHLVCRLLLEKKKQNVMNYLWLGQNYYYRKQLLCNLSTILI